MLAGLRPSIGIVGDALDNALCETTTGPHRTECSHGSPFRSGPIRTLADLEDIASAWVEHTCHTQTRCANTREASTCVVGGSVSRRDRLSVCAGRYHGCTRSPGTGELAIVVW